MTKVQLGTCYHQVSELIKLLSQLLYVVINSHNIMLLLCMDKVPIIIVTFNTINHNKLL